MGKRRDLTKLPEVPNGLTMTDLARELTGRLGRTVKPQDVYGAAVKPGRVPVGRAERLIPQQPRREHVLVVPANCVQDVEREVRAMFAKRETLDDGPPAS